MQKRKFHEAVMEFRAGAEIDKVLAQAHSGLDRSYENFGQLFETVEELRKTVESNPDKIEAKTKLGNYYLLIEPPMIVKTEKLLDEIFNQDANFIEGHILKASLFTAPENIEVRRGFAEFYAGTRQIEKAETAYKNLIQI
ncbi:MAG: hypothetical protein ABIP06_14605 [Pyrinomonadaceae bacterium]